MDKKAKAPPIKHITNRLRTNIAERPLVLVGLMGAGKTTIGKRIAQMLELDFYDADHEIERAAQMTIPELFELYGEQEFRNLEKRVIMRLIGMGPLVLATGGGAYMNADTRRAISEQGISVWLNADLDTLMERVSRKSNRPLLRNENPRSVMEKLMQERYPVYAQADITVMSSNTRRDGVARDMVRMVDKHLVRLQGEKTHDRNGKCNAR